MQTTCTTEKEAHHEVAHSAKWHRILNAAKNHLLALVILAALILAVSSLLLRP